MEPSDFGPQASGASGGPGSTCGGLFLKMPVAWEVTHLLISAAPESSENQKYMALGCPARTAEQETEQDVWPAAGGSLRSPSFSPWTARPLLPSHLALLMVVSFSLGPLKYG